VTFHYVDTHCHVDRYDDPPAVIRAALDRGTVIVAVTELPSDFQRLALRLGRKEHVRVALGAHPLRAGKFTRHELHLFEQMLPRTEYIGEVGLDGSRHGRDTYRRQREVFERVLSVTDVRSKALTVHSRGAEEDVLDSLASSGAHAILHWYSGALKHVDRALADGCYFSINPAMTRSEKGRRLIERLPRDRVLTETDGPYTRTAGRTAEPADIPAVVDALGRVWGMDSTEAGSVVWANMSELHRRATAG
jgi:TatD DNase family protein